MSCHSSPFLVVQLCARPAGWAGRPKPPVEAQAKLTTYEFSSRASSSSSILRSRERSCCFCTLHPPMIGLYSKDRSCSAISWRALCNSARDVSSEPPTESTPAYHKNRTYCDPSTGAHGLTRDHSESGPTFASKIRRSCRELSVLKLPNPLFDRLEHLRY